MKASNHSDHINHRFLEIRICRTRTADKDQVFSLSKTRDQINALILGGTFAFQIIEAKRKGFGIQKRVNKQK